MIWINHCFLLSYRFLKTSMNNFLISLSLCIPWYALIINLHACHWSFQEFYLFCKFLHHNFIIINSRIDPLKSLDSEPQPTFAAAPPMTIPLTPGNHHASLVIVQWSGTAHSGRCSLFWNETRQISIKAPANLHYEEWYFLKSTEVTKIEDFKKN